MRGQSDGGQEPGSPSVTPSRRHPPVTESLALQLQGLTQQCPLVAVLVQKGLVLPSQVLVECTQARVLLLQGLVGCCQLLVLELRVLLCERSEQGVLGAQSGIFHLLGGRRG